jgi:SAM-dependent methyltransferase
MTEGQTDRWSSGVAYDAYMGRWSRLVAVAFVDWLEVARGSRWLDVGCGTGALSQTILTRREPKSVVGVDASEPFVAHARATIDDARASFRVGTAEKTGLDDESVDAVVSALVLNFVPDLEAALGEALRVVRPGGVVAGYVWDYADGMQILRRFWDAAVALDPAAHDLDEAVRFPAAAPGPLETAFATAGLTAIEIMPITVPIAVDGFDDLWTPFLRGTGPAPAYVANLPGPDRDTLRERLRASLDAEPDGPIRLTARAWAVRGRRADGAPG